MNKDELVKSTNECIFFVSKSRCSILTQKKCINCKFQKDEFDLYEGRASAAERINTLPKFEQLKIAKKYGLSEV